MIERRADRLSAVGAQLAPALTRSIQTRETRLIRLAARLSPEPLHRRLDQRRARLESLIARFDPVLPRRLDQAGVALSALTRALASLDPGRPKPGFARVEDGDHTWLTSAAALSPGQAVRLVFADGAAAAHVDGEDDGTAPPSMPRPAPRPSPRPKAPPPGQGDLF